MIPTVKTIERDVDAKTLDMIALWVIRTPAEDVAAWAIRRREIVGGCVAPCLEPRGEQQEESGDA